MQTIEQLLRTALPDATITGSIFFDTIDIAVDSRSIKPGQLFLAIAGARQDGHDFLEQALDAGAVGLIVDKNRYHCVEKLPARKQAGICMICVDDTLEALARIAYTWRMQFDYPVIGITGSVGKTSTKELLRHILVQHEGDYYVSAGNLNTRIGVPLCMLQMRAHHRAAIFEVGIARRGEMKRIVAMLRPTNALITSIRHQHMDGLGLLADIALEKRTIFNYFKEDNIGIVNGDQPLLAQIGYTHPVIKFGLKTTNQIQARKVAIEGGKTSFVLKIYRERFPVIISSPHHAVVLNSLAAAAVAHVLGVPASIIVKAIQNPPTVAQRFEIKAMSVARGSMIDDCYNANPESVKQALLALEHIETPARKIVVLGDMLGLGAQAPFWHRQLGRFLRKISSLHHLILVGSLTEWTKKALPVDLCYDHVANWQEAADVLRGHLTNNEAIVLVKGSLDMHLDKLVGQFTK